MSSTNAFKPDYVVPPGEVLTEYLDSVGMTQRGLAMRTGLTPKTINEIIKGKAPISTETAFKLEKALGRPAHFWKNLENLYQEARVREEERERLSQNLEWLRRIPVRQMIDFGWLERRSNPEDQLDQVLRFFGVSSMENWETLWTTQKVAYRRAVRFEAEAEALSAWLRQGEHEAQDVSANLFNREAFREVLEKVRLLTPEPPEVFQPSLIELCASAGVVVAFVPALPKTRVSGATRWLTPEKALIQLSLRYKSDDQLWFTFFHEAGHVLLHGKSELFIEIVGGDGEAKELEANRFAENFLIHAKSWDQFVSMGRPTLSAVKDFAQKLGISPGIVVGRLQREGIFEYKRGNQLKRRLRWEPDA